MQVLLWLGMALRAKNPLPATLTPKQWRQFVAKIRVTESCWLWTGGYTRGSYGSFSVNGNTVRAARLSYRVFVGPFDESLHIDHLCHTMSDCTETEDCPHRACVNPHHLQPVSAKENHHRKHFRLKECANGHLMDVDNILVAKGRPTCRECGRLNAAASLRRKAEAAEQAEE